MANSYFPIEKLSHSAQQGAKNQLELQIRQNSSKMFRGFGFVSLEEIPNIVDVRVGKGRLIVTVTEYNPIHQQVIPTELTDSYENLPVDIELGGPLYTLQGSYVLSISTAKL